MDCDIPCPWCDAPVPVDLESDERLACPACAMTVDFAPELATGDLLLVA